MLWTGIIEFLAGLNYSFNDETRRAIISLKGKNLAETMQVWSPTGSWHTNPGRCPSMRPALWASCGEITSIDTKGFLTRKS